MGKYPSWAKDFSDRNLQDRDLLEILPKLAQDGVRWLDLRFNNITRDGLEHLCGWDLPFLEVAELFGNPCGCPTEIYKFDPATGEVIRNSIKANLLTQELETKFGYRKWFHPVTELGDPFPLPTHLTRLDPLFED